MRLYRPVAITAAVVMVAGLVAAAAVAGPLWALAHSGASSNANARIQHVVVIFQENVSFDHYFATYPNAKNAAGEPSFNALPGTPSVNGPSPALLTQNANIANPQRLDRSQAMTCDMNHRYADEQKAVDHGLMDQFVQTAGGSCTPTNPYDYNLGKNIVMDYYDGNTVTALWNYAQHFAMSDNSFSTNYGPSTVGALNLISGQTHGATHGGLPSPNYSNTVSNQTVIGDPGPELDDCAASYSTRVSMTGTNVGDLLNAKGVTWGWFQGGFRPTSVTNGVATCASTHPNIVGASVTDYIGHHEPFQYYASTANPHHLAPTSTTLIGHQGDQANHQYDLSDFWAAVNANNMPAVSFLKAAAYQDGHAGYSDPLDEQSFLVSTINRLEKTPDWNSTAVIIAYDDSDGWYDHALAPVVSQSNDPSYDALSGVGQCGTAPAGAYQDRCGYGPRQPLLVISPFARHNFVDHSVTDQTSILRFIEDNWNLGQIGNQSLDKLAGSLDGMLTKGNESGGSKLFLNPSTGEPQ